MLYTDAWKGSLKGRGITQSEVIRVDEMTSIVLPLILSLTFKQRDVIGVEETTEFEVRAVSIVFTINKD